MANLTNHVEDRVGGSVEWIILDLFIPGQDKTELVSCFHKRTIPNLRPTYVVYCHIVVRDEEIA